MISLNNLNSLLPRIFDLLHKTQRSLHLNTLEALVAMVMRYPQQFVQASSQIMKEVLPFVSDVDLQTASLGLQVAKFTLQASPTTPEV